MKNPIIIVLGTRPGAIKLIPLYLALKEAGMPVLLCATYQHDEMLQQVLDLFQVTPDFRLNIMKADQDLFYLTSALLTNLKTVFAKINPSLILVHGDTTTTFTAALAAFYLKIPIGHLEAGLRTGNKYSPFPEEINRKFVTHVATYHFAPTSLNVANLLQENVDRNLIFCTGNVVVDALNSIKKKIESTELIIDKKISEIMSSCKQQKKKTILLTAHRRESFDGGLLRIFTTVKKFAQKHDDVVVLFPVHPNPHVLQAVKDSGIEELKNVICFPPIAYKDLVYLILTVDWIMTDSGGIQEEGMSIGKKIIILRDITERIEGVWEGLGKLVGTNEQKIFECMTEFYALETTLTPTNLYGDGQACKRIVSILKSTLQFKKEKPNDSPCINHTVTEH